MLVIGSLLQISAFFAESRELSFPLFVISFFFGGAGMVFQVGVIYLFIYLPIRKFKPILPGCMWECLHCNSFKRFRIQNEYDTRCVWYSSFPPLPPNTPILTNWRNNFFNFSRCWSITCSNFLHILCSATTLGDSLSRLHILSCFQPLPSRWSL